MNAHLHEGEYPRCESVFVFVQATNKKSQSFKILEQLVGNFLLQITKFGNECFSSVKKRSWLKTHTFPHMY